MEPFEIFISGYAKLPTGTTAEELYKVIAVGILVDKNTGDILDADCTVVTDVAKKLIKKILIGKNILNFEEIEKIINERYFGNVKKALISSTKKCHDKFKVILEGNNG